MHKKLIFCLVALLPFCVKAQKAPGQIVINAGVGYSPEFNGQVPLGILDYPVSAFTEYGFTCSSIIPNLGISADYGLVKWFSLGIASSYQSETVTYSDPPDFSDRITRVNTAGRLLFHLSTKSLSGMDNYIGFRIGCSYWHDSPSPGNTIYNPYGPPISFTFLDSPSFFVPSFQVLFGMRFFYAKENVTIHLEAGIGSPYLIEGGLTFRIITGSNKTESTPQPQSFGGHPVN